VAANIDKLAIVVAQSLQPTGSSWTGTWAGAVLKDLQR